MKDLYSFHADEEDLTAFYEKVKLAYDKIFQRVGLKTIYTEASGGTFSQFSHEFQVLANSGEDVIYFCPQGHFARNKEIINNLVNCPQCGNPLTESRAIEVGNIFPLKTKYSESFNLVYTTRSGQQQLVVMGCYGIGITRLMGAIVEVFHDSRGIIWPKSVAPYLVHLIVLSPNLKALAEEAYERLQHARIEVLFDDREGVTPGEKFADCDLIGLPVRLVVSEKLARDEVEWKDRINPQTKILKLSRAIELLSPNQSLPST